MREADRRECWALGRTPKEALRIGLRTGLHAMTAIEDSGQPAAMWGLHVTSLVGGEATPWFLGTDRVFMHPRELLRIGSRIVAWWRSEYPYMRNIVSVENDRAIRLLRHWGAEIGETRELHRGVAFVPFAFPPAIQAAQPRP